MANAPLYARADVALPNGPCSSFLHAPAQATPDRIAIIFEGEHLTFAALQARIDRARACLVRNGIGPGDRIGLCLGNTPEFVIWTCAGHDLGVVVVPLYEFRARLRVRGAE